jgi:hypothetical protein
MVVGIVSNYSRHLVGSLILLCIHRILYRLRKGSGQCVSELSQTQLKGTTMAFSKIIPVGSAGSLTIAEQAGEAKFILSLNEAVGGGKTAGALKAGVAIEVDVEGKALIDAGFAIAIAKFPGVSAILAQAQALIDAEIAAN